MSRFDTKPEDWDKAADEGEDAESSGGLFIQKRMKQDLSTIYVAFLEIPKFGRVTYPDGKTSDKGQANVASFGRDGNAMEEGVFIIEMAPKHINRFIAKLRKPKYGLGMLYEIERHGKPNDTQTYYEIDDVRALTQEEMDFLDTVELHKLFSRQDDSASASSPPSAVSSVSVFMKQCHDEAVRLGWAKDRDILKQNMVVANKTFFKGMLESKDMTHDQQARFLEGLKAMEPGQEPGAIVDVTADKLDLDEDVDFF